MAGVAGTALVTRDVGATVAEQRARLPPPAECEDEVEGIWRSHAFWAPRFEWYITTLEVHRVAKGSPELKGTILAEYWNGGTKDQEAPPCTAGRYHLIVRMPGTGTIRSGDISFGASTWSLDKVLCGGSTGYNPDRFTGRIDPKIQEFQSVNNDGGAAVNLPTVFRRVHCFDEAAPVPTVAVRPPGFGPPKKRAGCECGLAMGSSSGSAVGGVSALLLALGARRARRRCTIRRAASRESEA